jgi:hypothetical protein
MTTFVAGGIAGTLVGIATKLVWDGVVDRLGASDVVISVLLILAVVTLISMTTLMSRKVDHLVEKASFSIKYHSADEASRLYEFCREMISKSDPDVEIYAVNSYVEAFKDSNSPEDEDMQRRYLGAFEHRFATMKYHRLIQVRNGDNEARAVKLGDLLAPAYRDHYRKMATFAKVAPGSRVKIEEVPATLPTSFVILKDRNSNGGRIIWQMNKHNQEAEEVERIMGVFLITDPDGLLVPCFLQWFEEIDRGAREVTVGLLE